MKIETTYKHKNPLVKFYFDRKMKNVIKLANLKKTDLILDFGCGPRYLEKFVRSKGYNIVGYDINPELTEIKDYTKLKPTKIIAMDVLEHMTKEEIKKTIKNFKEINPNFILIASIPTQNLISRKIRKLVGKTEIAIGHITTLKEILEILKEDLKIIRKKDFFTINKIFVMKNKYS